MRTHDTAAMLTIFTIPKAFKGHEGMIQRNAIESWRRLRPECEIILCADDPGVAEVADEYGLKHLPGIARNEYGTPMLDSAFDQVTKVAKNPLLCYVNADIILFSDLPEAVKRIKFEKFLMAGQRWDLDITEPLNFKLPEWERRLRRHLADTGTLHFSSGSDYFLFPRESELEKLPPFAVGRPGWDNWLIYNARKLNFRVIDATKAVVAIHQNHGYDHVPRRGRVKSHGPEGDENRRLAGGKEHLFTLVDATHVMNPRWLLPAFGFKHIIRRLELVQGNGSAVHLVGRWVLRIGNPVKVMVHRVWGSRV